MRTLILMAALLAGCGVQDAEEALEEAEAELGKCEDKYQEPCQFVVIPVAVAELLEDRWTCLLVEPGEDPR